MEVSFPLENFQVDMVDHDIEIFIPKILVWQSMLRIVWGYLRLNRKGMGKKGAIFPKGIRTAAPLTAFLPHLFRSGQIYLKVIKMKGGCAVCWVVTYVLF